MSPDPTPTRAPAPDDAAGANAATEQMIGSLGQALAGVNLGGSNNHGFGFQNDSNGSAPGGNAHGHHAHNGAQDGASHFAAANHHAGNAPASNGADSGWGYTNHSAASNGNHADASSPTSDIKRNKGFDLFLSQSPSQTLGADVFKLSSNNLPGLGIQDENRASTFPGGQSLAPGPVGASTIQSQIANGNGASAPARRRNDSPVGSVTGTTTSSRSSSPYDAGRNTIGAYHPKSNVGAGAAVDVSANLQTSFANVNGDGGLTGATHNVIGANAYNMATMPIGHAPTGHPNHLQMDHLQGQQLNGGVPSPYLGNAVPHIHAPVNGYNNPNNMMYGNQIASPGQQQLHPNAVGSPPPQQEVNNGNTNQQQPQQQQILYMAVPTADGRQVLQPVQMVQMPGKPFAYILPNGATAPMPPGATGMDGQQMPQVMVMPGMQHGGVVNGMPEHSNMRGMVAGSPNLNDSMNKSIGGYGSPGGMDSGKYKRGGGNGYGRSKDFGSPSGGKANDDQYGVPGGNALNQSSDTLNSLYALPQRPPLDQLLGQVRRLSRDQVGCRLVQQALDEEGPMAATLILNEGLPFWGEAMVDPFGNYLFQKILEKITAKERVMLVKSVSTRLVNASLNLHGTRSVQKVVELCAIDEGTMSTAAEGKNEEADAAEDAAATAKSGGDTEGEESAADILTRSLTPAAARLCIDSHGNHVIQRILLKLGPTHSQFIFDAVAESVGDVARHRHGCCVIQRCLDSPPSDARSNLVGRIVDKSLELMQDAYGNYVVQYVLDVCTDSDVHAVCESVVGKVNLLAIQKFSSNVMEKCLERCTDRVKEKYMAELADSERIRELMMDPFGNYVVQRSLSVATHSQAVRLVEAMRPHLIATLPASPNGQRNGGVRNTAGGRRIMAKICRRFPNFTLQPVGSTDDMYSQNKSHHHSNNSNHHGHHHGNNNSNGNNHHGNDHSRHHYGRHNNHGHGHGHGRSHNHRRHHNHHHHNNNNSHNGHNNHNNNMGPMYGQMDRGHHAGPNQAPQGYQQQHFNGNAHGMMNPVRQHQMFEQQQASQPYYDVPQTGFVEHPPPPYMPNMNHGGYANRI